MISKDLILRFLPDFKKEFLVIMKALSIQAEVSLIKRVDVGYKNKFLGKIKTRERKC